MRTVLEHLKAQNDRPGDPAVCHLLAGGIETTIRQSELIAHAAAYARMYHRLGAGRQRPVLIILRHSPDLLYAFVGAMLAGAVPAFLAPISEKQDPDRYWPALRQLFARVDAGALVIGRADRGELEGRVDVAGMPVLTPEDCSPSPAAPAWPNPAPEDIAFLQFSSGTTGQRKGVMLRHDLVAAQLHALQQALHLGSGDCIASWLPLYHDMGLIACLVAPLALGVPVVMLDPFEWAHRPSLLLQAIARHRATHVWLPNFAFNHLVACVGAAEHHDLGSVKAFINCSEPCKATSMRSFAQRFAGMGVRPEQLQACYAMAEAVFAVTQTPLGTAAKIATVDGVDLVSAGRPVDGIEVAIVGTDGTVLPDAAVGEIAIRGDCVFSGYYNAAAETAAAFRDGWFRTGDLGFLQDGELHVTGRSKDVLISSGKNFYAHDIEAIASEVAGVKPGRAVAFGLYNDVSGSEDVIVIAELTLPEGPAQKALARRVKSAVLGGLNLTVAKVFIAPPRWLAKTTSGKLSRRDNRDKYLLLTADGLRKAG